MIVFLAVLDSVRNHLQRVSDQTSNQHQPVINLRVCHEVATESQQHMERKGGTEGLETWRAANDSHFISPTQGPLCLPRGAPSRVCFHCTIQNKWKPQMRNGHLRNWNHEVHKKNTKNTHIIVCCSLCVCVPFMISLAVWRWWCVFHAKRNRRGRLCLYSCILHETTVYFVTI